MESELGDRGAGVKGGGVVKGLGGEGFKPTKAGLPFPVVPW